MANKLHANQNTYKAILMTNNTTYNVAHIYQGQSVYIESLFPPPCIFSQKHIVCMYTSSPCSGPYMDLWSKWESSIFSPASLLAF